MFGKAIRLKQLNDYIGYYNKKRIKEKLDGLCPVEYRKNCLRYNPSPTKKVYLFPFKNLLDSPFSQN
ncbi:IS3 family transposase [Lysinibacillus sp. NPDC097162]|uniref:IS3 family transposase n=1 Tax=Lysinibacillus sp. NPDC097162 TaxID=3364140 RepID=UPI003811E025